MGTTPNTNGCSPSTTWEWKKVKIRRPPEADKASRAKRGRWYHLPALDWRRPTTIRVKYRGGAEAWWEVTARGSTGRFPGSVAIHDVMRAVFQQP